MHFRKLDLNLLVALNSLLKHRSVTATADELKLSPSSVSSSLSRLREYFGDDLLTKVGRKMEITPLGESLRDPVRDILNRIDSTIILKPEFEPEATDRTFSLFISEYTQFLLFPELLALAEKQSSTAKFNLLRQINATKKALERGEADMLIIPESFRSPENPHEMLFSETFVCLVCQQSDLAKQELTASAYRNARHCIMHLADGIVDHIEIELSTKHRLERNIALSTYSLTSLPSLMLNTNYVATVHKRLARKMASFFPLAIKPLPFTISPMQQCMQWHHYRAGDPGILWMRQLIKQAVVEMEAKWGNTPTVVA